MRIIAKLLRIVPVLVQFIYIFNTEYMVLFIHQIIHVFKKGDTQ